MRSITTIEAVQPLKLRSGALLLPSEQALAAATASPCARPPSVWREMFRTDTVLLLAFLSIANLKSSFYLSTFSDHMHELFSSASAEHLTVGLGIAFPLGGCLTSVGAAVLLRERQAPEAKLAELLVDVVCDGLLPIVLGGERREDAVREVSRGVPHHRELFAEVEAEPDCGRVDVRMGHGHDGL